MINSLDVNVVLVDIKPGSCENPVNKKSKGKLPVAIIGTQDFDVTEIDISSIQLEGVTPIKTKTEDVVGKDCNNKGPDGHLDINLKFRTQDIVAAMGEINDGDVITFQLTGSLNSGTEFEGEDKVLIPNKGNDKDSDKDTDSDSDSESDSNSDSDSDSNKKKRKHKKK